MDADKETKAFTTNIKDMKKNERKYCPQIEHRWNTDKKRKVAPREKTLRLRAFAWELFRVFSAVPREISEIHFTGVFRGDKKYKMKQTKENTEMTGLKGQKARR